MKKYKISDEDRALFRQTIGEVKKVRTSSTVQTTISKKIPTRIKQPDFSEPVVLDAINNLEQVSGEDKLFFTKDGLSHKIIQQLKRGHLHCEEELDLHLLTIAQAEQILHDFLLLCYQRNKRWVRIIHGKGSSNLSSYPILKNQVNSWLRAHPFVLAFSSAQNKDGGTGAVYVLLKRNQ